MSSKRLNNAPFVVSRTVHVESKAGEEHPHPFYAEGSPAYGIAAQVFLLLSFSICDAAVKDGKLRAAMKMYNPPTMRFLLGAKREFIL